MEQTTANDSQITPWLDAEQAAARARCGRKSIYSAVRCSRLRAARLHGRRDLRVLPEWVDAWLIDSSQPTEQVKR